MLPLLAVVGAGAYGYHTLEIGKRETAIAQLERNNVVLKENSTSRNCSRNRNSVKSKREKLKSTARSCWKTYRSKY